MIYVLFLRKLLPLLLIGIGLLLGVLFVDTRLYIADSSGHISVTTHYGPFCVSELTQFPPTVFEQARPFSIDKKKRLLVSRKSICSNRIHSVYEGKQFYGAVYGMSRLLANRDEAESESLKFVFLRHYWTNSDANRAVEEAENRARRVDEQTRKTGR